MLLVSHAGLLEERVEAVYKLAPGYSEKATSLFVLDLGPPQDLPDALRGESWLFVQLPLSMLQQELRSVDTQAIFGDSFKLHTAGLDDLPADTLIPGQPFLSAIFPCTSYITPSCIMLSAIMEDAVLDASTPRPEKSKRTARSKVTLANSCYAWRELPCMHI